MREEEKSCCDMCGHKTALPTRWRAVREEAHLHSTFHIQQMRSKLSFKEL
jgi:hypothetical protein